MSKDLFLHFVKKKCLKKKFGLLTNVALRGKCRPIRRGWGPWEAQSFERLTLGFSAGHDLSVVGSSPASGSVLSVASA